MIGKLGRIRLFKETAQQEPVYIKIKDDHIIVSWKAGLQYKVPQAGSS